MFNELGEKIPLEIRQKAQNLGCLNTKYIYKDGEYGNKCPAASIGGHKCSRFQNLDRAEMFKEDIGDGWVAFRSPSASNRSFSSRRYDKNKSTKIIDNLPPHSFAIAKKHIDISLKIEDIVKEFNLPYITYIATYGIGRSGQAYQRIEEESMRTYYSIKMYSTNPPAQHSQVKDPDVVIIEDRKVKYAIEVKWGYGEKATIESDLFKVFTGDEYERHLQAVKTGKIIRVRGPACEEGNRYRSKQFGFERNFEVTDETKYIVVSDFYNLNKNNPGSFNQLFPFIEQNRDNMICLDIGRSFEKIKSLRDWLS